MACAKIAKRFAKGLTHLQAASRPLHPSPCANARGPQVICFTLPSAGVK